MWGSHVVRRTEIRAPVSRSPHDPPLLVQSPRGNQRAQIGYMQKWKICARIATFARTALARVPRILPCRFRGWTRADAAAFRHPAPAVPRRGAPAALRRAFRRSGPADAQDCQAPSLQSSAAPKSRLVPAPNARDSSSTRRLHLHFWHPPMTTRTVRAARAREAGARLPTAASSSNSHDNLPQNNDNQGRSTSQCSFFTETTLQKASEGTAQVVEQTVRRSVLQTVRHISRAASCSSGCLAEHTRCESKKPSFRIQSTPSAHAKRRKKYHNVT